MTLDMLRYNATEILFLRINIGLWEILVYFLFKYVCFSQSHNPRHNPNRCFAISRHFKHHKCECSHQKQRALIHFSFFYLWFFPPTFSVWKTISENGTIFWVKLHKKGLCSICAWFIVIVFFFKNTFYAQICRKDFHKLVFHLRHELF